MCHLDDVAAALMWSARWNVANTGHRRTSAATTPILAATATYIGHVIEQTIPAMLILMLEHEHSGRRGSEPPRLSWRRWGYHLHAYSAPSNGRPSDADAVHRRGYLWLRATFVVGGPAML